MLDRKNFLFYSTIYFDEFAAYVNSFKVNGKFDAQAMCDGMVEAKEALQDNNINTENAFAKRLLEIAVKLRDNKRKAGTASADARWGNNSPIPPPADKSEFAEFVAQKNLPEDIAQDWYALNSERGWKDQAGNRIKNWKGALINYCKKEMKK